MGYYKKDTKKNKIGDTKKPFSMNLNIYRNTHSFMLNTAKKNFKELIRAENHKIKFEGKVYMIYKLYTKDSRKSDLLNWVSIVSKFYEDSLVELGILTEDNYSVIPIILTIYGGKDKEKQGYMEVTVTESIQDLIDELEKYKENE
jgi:hypothetical protein